MPTGRKLHYDCENCHKLLSKIGGLQGEITRLRREINASKQECGAGKGDVLLCVSDVCEMVGVCERTMFRLVASGKFPQPIRYNRKLVRWKKSDVDRYIQNQS